MSWKIFLLNTICLFAQHVAQAQGKLSFGATLGINKTCGSSSYNSYFNLIGEYRKNNITSVISPKIGIWSKLNFHNLYSYMGLEYCVVGESSHVQTKRYNTIDNFYSVEDELLIQKFNRVSLPTIVGYHIKWKKKQRIFVGAGYRINYYVKGNVQHKHVFNYPNSLPFIAKDLDLDPFSKSDFMNDGNRFTFAFHAELGAKISKKISCGMSYVANGITGYGNTNNGDFQFYYYRSPDANIYITYSIK